jgi:hypothetical protein
MAAVIESSEQLLVVLALDMRILVPGLYLAGAFLVGAVIIALIRRWWREEGKGVQSSDELARYRTLYEQGSINEEEFKRLRGVLGGELRQSVDLPPKPAHPEPPPSDENTKPPTDGIRPG